VLNIASQTLPVVHKTAFLLYHSPIPKTRTSPDPSTKKSQEAKRNEPLEKPLDSQAASKIKLCIPFVIFYIGLIETVV
jgi:hypothetical protein